MREIVAPLPLGATGLGALEVDAAAAAALVAVAGEEESVAGEGGIEATVTEGAYEVEASFDADVAGFVAAAFVVAAIAAAAAGVVAAAEAVAAVGVAAVEVVAVEVDVVEGVADIASAANLVEVAPGMLEQQHASLLQSPGVFARQSA